jgi:hypothetical protein
MFWLSFGHYQLTNHLVAKQIFGKLIEYNEIGYQTKKISTLTHSEKLIGILCYVGGLAFLPFVDNFKLSVFGNILIWLLLSDSRNVKSTQTKEYTV